MTTNSAVTRCCHWQCSTFTHRHPHTHTQHLTNWCHEPCACGSPAVRSCDTFDEWAARAAWDVPPLRGLGVWLPRWSLGSSQAGFTAAPVWPPPPGGGGGGGGERSVIDDVSCGQSAPSGVSRPRAPPQKAASL